LIQDKASREAVRVAERFADALAIEEERQAAQAKAAVIARSVHKYPSAPYYAARACAAAVATKARKTLGAAAEAMTAQQMQQIGDPQALMTVEGGLVFQRIGAEASAEQCILLRDIFQAPGRHVTLDPTLLTHTVTSMAQVIYTEGRYENLAILADALEDAGCSDNEVLSHCRSPGPHARGCWIVDLLLGKR